MTQENIENAMKLTRFAPKGDTSMHFSTAYRRVMLLLLLCIVLAILASSNALHNFLMVMLAATQRIIVEHAGLGAAIFIALAAVSAMFAFVSVAIIIPA